MIKSNTNVQQKYTCSLEDTTLGRETRFVQTGLKTVQYIYMFITNSKVY